MEEKKSPQKIIVEFIAKNPLFLGIIILGALFLTVGILQYFHSNGNSNQAEFISGSNQPTGSDPAGGVKGISVEKISVDVEGKVIKPGVYTLDLGDRVKDALIAAGGFSKDADRTYIAKNINLAQKVSDGGKIYIPAVGEINSISNTKLGVEPLQQGIEGGIININTASIEQLDKLPRVGVVTAQKIISERPYGTIDELVSKKILSQKTFDALKNLISAN